MPWPTSCKQISGGPDIGRASRLALPLGELSPKVTERALQARSNGNSKQRESQVSLSGGCAASSPKGRAKYRSQRTAAVVHTAVAVNYLMNTPCPPEAFPCSGQYCEIAAPCSARLAMTSQETCRVRGQGGRQGICIPRLKAIGVLGKCGRKLPHFPHTPRMRLHPAPKNRGWVTDFADQISR